MQTYWTEWNWGNSGFTVTVFTVTVTVTVTVYVTPPLYPIDKPYFLRVGIPSGRNTPTYPASLLRWGMEMAKGHGIGWRRRTDIRSPFEKKWRGYLEVADGYPRCGLGGRSGARTPGEPCALRVYLKRCKVYARRCKYLGELRSTSSRVRVLYSNTVYAWYFWGSQHLRYCTLGSLVIWK